MLHQPNLQLRLTFPSSFLLSSSLDRRDMSRYGSIYGLTEDEHLMIVKANDDGVSGMYV